MTVNESFESEPRWVPMFLEQVVQENMIGRVGDTGNSGRIVEMKGGDSLLGFRPAESAAGFGRMLTDGFGDLFESIPREMQYRL